MADFDYVAWGNSHIGTWVTENLGSGIYRGQCTQVIRQLLYDIGYPNYAVARGDGKDVGPNMVALGEAVYVGDNLTTIPANEIHVVSTDGVFGHVFVVALGDLVYESNITVAGSPTRNYGAGTTYPFRLGRLGESWRGHKRHYKLIVPTDYDNINGDGGSAGNPGGGHVSGGAQDVNDSFFKYTAVKKTKSNPMMSVKDKKRYTTISLNKNK